MSASPSSAAAGTSSKPSVVSNIHKAVKCKEQGNKAFDEGDFQTAMRNWHEGLLHVAGINSFASMYGAKSTSAQNQKAQELTNAFRSNLAAVYVKQEAWNKAIYATSKVLENDPENTKALYRRALAYLRKKDPQKAAGDLDIALGRAPKDPALRRLALELVEQEEDRVAKLREAEAAEAEAKENQKRQEEEAKKYAA